MNDWLFKKSFHNITVILMLSILLLGAGIQSGRAFYYKRAVSKYRAELEQVRGQLESAENRESAIEAITNEAIQYVDRADQLYSQSITTVGELREQINQVRKYTEGLENYIYCIRQYSFNGNLSDNNTNKYIQEKR